MIVAMIFSRAPSSSHSSSGEVANTGTAFHGWKYKHYFVVVNEDSKNQVLEFAAFCVLEIKRCHLLRTQLQISRNI